MRLAGKGRPAGRNELAAARVSLIWLLGERGRDQVVERLRQLRPQVGDVRRRVVQVGVDEREVALALERPLSGAC